MTDAEYTEILRTHGRRVANRVVLLATPLDQRILNDFYDCYSPELIDLPKHEHCRTPLIHTFDPAGWHALYSNSRYAPWPEPEGALEPDTSVVNPDLATKEAQLRAAIAEAGRSVWAAVVDIAGDEAQTKRGGELIEEHCARLAAAFNIAADQHNKLFNAIVEEANAAAMIEQEG